MSDTPYSPRLRTGVVLCGCGTAGGYQAGVLRALAEAGVKVDVLAAHGAGVVNALCCAVDGGARLWDAGGPWTSPRLQRAYRWRPAIRIAIVGLWAAMGLLLTPLLVLIAASGTYALSVLASLASLTTTAEALVRAYAQAIEWLFAPPVLPTIVPRAVVLALLIVAGVLAVAAVRAARQVRARRRFRGAFWGRLLGAPIDPTEPSAVGLETLWQLVRGASGGVAPGSPRDVGRRYVDLLTENLGQPGFSEVIVAVHDLDARRDLVAAVLADRHRPSFAAPRAADGPREAGAFDLTGPMHVVIGDVVAGALRQPVAHEPAVVTFPAGSYWHGETHRLCDRPDLPVRLVEELAGLGVEQVILVSAAEPPAVPHGMRPKDADLRARMGEVARSIETAALGDALALGASRFAGVFLIRPGHNPIMPFAFRGTWDEASDRHRGVGELIEQGYRDAYRQFIEPVVAAGDRVEAGGAAIA